MPLQNNASLRQVMDKFEILSNMDLANIDIVVKSELPSTVKNGQIVIITNTYNNIVLQTDKLNYTFEENDVYIKLFQSLKEVFTISSKNRKINLYVMGAEKYSKSKWSRLDSYIGSNGTWISMNSNVLLDNLNIEKYRDLYEFKTESSYPCIVEFRSDHIYAQISDDTSSYGQCYAITKDFIDMSIFNTLNVELYGCRMGAFIEIVDEQGKVVVSHNEQGDAKKTIQLDISNANGKCRVRYVSRAIGGYVNGFIQVYNCWLE